MNGIRDKYRIFFVLAAFVAAAYLIFVAVRWTHVIRSYESLFVATDGSGRTASASPGRIFLDNDAYYWVGYAQTMAETGSWRIRHTSADNTPEGRPVHWSQSISWLLVLAGSVRHLVSGEPLSSAIETAASWIGPLQFFVLAVATGFLLFRRLGLAPSLLWMVNLLTIIPIQWSFHPMRPDHHGLHLAFVFSSLLCLILGGLGWTRPGGVNREVGAFFSPLLLPDRHRARRFFIASGVLGGLGIWTGATVQLFGVGLFALGAILLVTFMPTQFSEQQEPGTVYEPSLWRLWATTGAITSLVFYLIEYAPAFPGMRLEVNHPLYAVSWFCVGEVLTRISAGKMRGASRNDLVTGLFGLGALVLPALLLFGPPEWHTMRDPMMRRLHQFIEEFRPYRFAFAAPWSSALTNFGVLPVFVGLAPFLAGEKRTSLYEWAALWMAFLPALAYAALALWQVRWMNFFAVSGLLLAVIALAILWRHRRARGRMGIWLPLLIAAVAGQCVYFVSLQLRDIEFRDISRDRIGELITPMLQRQFAENLGERDTNDTFRLMASPNLTARLYYYGHLPGVASYYWENIEGLRAAADFFAAEDDGVARRIVQERGITHVVVPPSAGVVQMFYYVKNGYYSEPGARASIGGRMLAQPEALPPWLHRDVDLERSLQPGYLFAGEPIVGTLRVFVIRPDRL